MSVPTIRMSIRYSLVTKYLAKSSKGRQKHRWTTKDLVWWLQNNGRNFKKLYTDEPASDMVNVTQIYTVLCIDYYLFPQ